MQKCECCKQHLKNELLSDLDIWWDKDEDEREEEVFKQHTAPPTTSLKSSSSSFLPMEFIQVLIHQHAKTLVALKTLRTEVRTLKKPPPPQHYYAKPIDSGLFSTKSSQKSSTSSCSGDELYSLLSQIQDKISSLKPRHQGGEKKCLGYLDNVLGNEDFDFRGKKVDQKVVRAVLGCDDVGELRRQVLFFVAKWGSIPSPPPKPSSKSGQKSALKSLNSNSLSPKSLIPVPIARSKRKMQQQQQTPVTNRLSFPWGQWFNNSS